MGPACPIHSKPAITTHLIFKAVSSQGRYYCILPLITPNLSKAAVDTYGSEKHTDTHTQQDVWVCWGCKHRMKELKHQRTGLKGATINISDRCHSQSAIFIFFYKHLCREGFVRNPISLQVNLLGVVHGWLWRKRSDRAPLSSSNILILHCIRAHTLRAWHSWLSYLGFCFWSHHIFIKHHLQRWGG